MLYITNITLYMTNNGKRLIIGKQIVISNTKFKTPVSNNRTLTNSQKDRQQKTLPRNPVAIALSLIKEGFIRKEAETKINVWTTTQTKKTKPKRVI